MGWNARQIGIKVEWRKGDRDPIPEFRAAAEKVIEAVGSCDGELEYGDLCLRSCQGAMHKYLSNYILHASMYDMGIVEFEPDGIEGLLADAKWPDMETLSEDDRVGVASLRTYLETCLSMGLGIHISY